MLNTAMDKEISVAILDDHQGIIDGYLYRLENTPDICVTSTMTYGEDLEPTLKKQPVDVLILDIEVPTSANNQNPYPILYLVPKLLERYPGMSILVISMHIQRVLAQKVMEAGASGFILKDDRAAILNLPSAIRMVHNGGVYFSQAISKLLIKSHHNENDTQLTPRQTEVLSFCAAHPESTTQQIAEEMNVAPSTVRNLLSGAYIALEVPNRAAAIAKGKQLGIIT